MNKDLIIALALITLTQTITYFQLQSQFFWEWARNNVLLLSAIGFPISYALFYFTKHCAAAFDGQTWPGRLIGFSVGAIIFALLSYFIMKEPMTAKTVICVCLAAVILCIQILWK